MSELLQAVEVARRDVSALEAMQVAHANDEAQVLLRERDLLLAVVARLEAEVHGVPKPFVSNAAMKKVFNTAYLGLFIGLTIGLVAAVSHVPNALLVGSMTVWTALLEKRRGHVS